MGETKITIEATNDFDANTKIVLEAPFEMTFENWVAFIDHVKAFKACPQSYWIPEA